MLEVITATMMVIGPVANWLLTENEKLDAEAEKTVEIFKRVLAHRAAKEIGKGLEEREVPSQKWVEVPPGDPAWGGKPVRLTPQEAAWWMGACRCPGDHIPEIRRITRLQPSRWA